MDALDQSFAVGEVAAEEPDERVARHGLVGGVHGDLAEEVLRSRVEDDQRPQSVPEVVQRVDALRIAACLVGGLDERAAQLDGPRQVFAAEPVAEAEIVLGGEVAGPFRGADDETVAADDLFGRGIPDDQLVVAVAGQVLFVDVHLAARAAACAPECHFAQTPHLAHQRGALPGGEDVDFVAGLVRVAHLPVGRQLGAQQVPVYGRQDRFGLFQSHNGNKSTNFSGFSRPRRACFPENTSFCVLPPSVRAGSRSVAVRPPGSGRLPRYGSVSPFGRTFRRGARAFRC